MYKFSCSFFYFTEELKQQKKKNKCSESRTAHHKPRNCEDCENDANNLRIGTELHIKRIKYYNDHNIIGCWVEVKLRDERRQTNGNESERAGEWTNERKNIQHKPKKNAIGIFVAWSSETKEREKKEEVEHWTNEEMKWNARKWSVWQLLKARLQQLMLVVAPNQRVVCSMTLLSRWILYIMLWVVLECLVLFSPHWIKNIAGNYRFETRRNVAHRTMAFKTIWLPFSPILQCFYTYGLFVWVSECVWHNLVQSILPFDSRFRSVFRAQFRCSSHH